MKLFIIISIIPQHKVIEFILRIYLVPLLPALANKNPVRQQLEFSHSDPLSGTCTFSLGVECVPALHVEKEQGF